MFGCRSLSSLSSIEMDGSDLGGFSYRHDCCQPTVLQKYFRSTWEYGFTIGLIRICKYFCEYYTQLLSVETDCLVKCLDFSWKSVYVPPHNESDVIIYSHVVPNPCDFPFLCWRMLILLFFHTMNVNIEREHLLSCTVKKRLIKTSYLHLWKVQDLQVSHLLRKCTIFSF